MENSHSATEHEQSTTEPGQSTTEHGQSTTEPQQSTTQTPQSTSQCKALPVEPWTMIFEELELPLTISILHKPYIDLIRTRPRDYDHGESDAVKQLPRFERMMWAKMRRFYNSNRSLREIATQRRIFESWLNEAMIPYPGTIPYPRLATTHRMTHNFQKQVANSRLAVSFVNQIHGSWTPEYVAVELYFYLGGHEGPDVVRSRWMFELRENLALLPIRRIDLITTAPIGVQRAVDAMAEEGSRVIQAFWNELGVHDRVIRVFR